MQQGWVGAEERTGSVRRHGATFAGEAPFNRPPKITAHGQSNDWAAFRKTPVSQQISPYLHEAPTDIVICDV